MTIIAQTHTVCSQPDECRFIMVGGDTITTAYYQPIYDSQGRNINPDRNAVSASQLRCLTCGKTK